MQCIEQILLINSSCVEVEAVALGRLDALTVDEKNRVVAEGCAVLKKN